MSDLDQFLEHHGVKGQKWGIRNKKQRVVSNKEKTHFKKAPARLSDEELNRRIQRMNMEQRYSELNKTKLDHGSAFAKSFMIKTGAAVASTLLTGVAVYAGKKIIKKKFGIDI